MASRIGTRYNTLMQFIQSSDWHPAIMVLQKRLQQELANGRKVLWLLSGGSNVQASVTIMNALAPSDSRTLTMMLADERYGAVGHEESNATKLLAAGFDTKEGTLLPILMPNTSFSATRDRYDSLARQAFSESDIVIAQFGIGPDGHIAGILPHSEAVTSPEFVCAYAAEPFQRLTLTHHALKRVSAAYVLAFGQDKREALAMLNTKMVSYSDQPSQILKELPEAYVFNDHISDVV